MGFTLRNFGFSDAVFVVCLRFDFIVVGIFLSLVFLLCLFAVWLCIVHSSFGGLVVFAYLGVCVYWVCCSALVLVCCVFSFWVLRITLCFGLTYLDFLVGLCLDDFVGLV